MAVDRRPLLLLEVPVQDDPEIAGFLMDQYIADSPILILTHAHPNLTKEGAKAQVRSIGRKIADDLTPVTAGLFIGHWIARLAHTDAEIDEHRGARSWTDVLYVGTNMARARRLEALGCQTARLGPDDMPWDLMSGTPILDNFDELNRYWKSLAVA